MAECYFPSKQTTRQFLIDFSFPDDAAAGAEDNCEAYDSADADADADDDDDVEIVIE